MNIIKEADAITDAVRFKFNNAVSVYFETIEDKINNGGESSIKTVVDTVTDVFDIIGNIIREDGEKVIPEEFFETDFLQSLNSKYNELYAEGMFDFITKYSYVFDSPRESDEDEISFYRTVVKNIQDYGNNVLLPEFNLNISRLFAMKLMVKFEKGL